MEIRAYRPSERWGKRGVRSLCKTAAICSVYGSSPTYSSLRNTGLLAKTQVSVDSFWQYWRKPLTASNGDQPLQEYRAEKNEDIMMLNRYAGEPAGAISRKRGNGFSPMIPYGHSRLSTSVIIWISLPVRLGGDGGNG